jgi:hypothetical protein
MHFRQVSVAVPHRRSRTPTGNHLWLSLIPNVLNTNATTSEYSRSDKFLFEATSRIIKRGERENVTLDKAAGCAACSKPTHKGRKKNIASRLIEHQRKQSTQCQRNLQERRHQQLIPMQTTRRKIVKTKNSSYQYINEAKERERERKGKESDTVSGRESSSGRECPVD